MKIFMQYIAVNRDIRSGKPCIKGTRITIGDILGWLASGMSVQEICADFPELDEKAIRAALAFAAQRDATSHIFIHENNQVIA
jgi:uncharacterized protein (DUF433 family)